MDKNYYYRFSKYFKDTGFKQKVRKITVNAGFSCPNRDGKISTAGCVFCNNEGFSRSAIEHELTIMQQIEKTIVNERGKKKEERGNFIVYFQPYSNTYADLEALKAAYDQIKGFDEIVGISIGTRPDCVDEKIIELINSYSDKYIVWLEYGIQSVHDKTLEMINRGHKFSDFVNAVKITKNFPKIKICAHAILGLPGETIEMMNQTAEELNALKIDGIKIHPLHVVKNTQLANAVIVGKASNPFTQISDQSEYKLLYSNLEVHGARCKVQGKDAKSMSLQLPGTEHLAPCTLVPNVVRTNLLSMEEYAVAAVDFLERLRPNIVVQRVTADCPPELLIGPGWINDKNGVLLAIDKEFEKRSSFQGKRAA